MMPGRLGAVSKPLGAAEGLRPYGGQEGRRYPWEVGFGSGPGKAAAEVSWAVQSWRCQGAFPRERLRGCTWAVDVSGRHWHGGTTHAL